MIDVREATPDDAHAMSAILTGVLVAWDSPRPRSPQHVLAHYIAHPDAVLCPLAVDEAGEALGFQALKIAREGNPYDLPKGWGIIGTYVSAAARGRGVGKALFASSRAAAAAAGMTEIDATIGDTNAQGLAYYEAMGFETYKRKPGAICKKFTLTE